MKTLKLSLQFNGTEMRSIDLSALALKFIGWIAIVLLPIKPALIAVALLVFADFFTGVWASVKEGKPLTSTGFRRTVMKSLAYEAAIIFAFVLQTYLLEGMPVVNVITGLIGVTEGKSFFENIRRITGIDFWTQIISKLNMPDAKLPKPPDEKKDV
jgi:formate hydrogenlyase subunit 4